MGVIWRESGQPDLWAPARSLCEHWLWRRRDTRGQGGWSSACGHWLPYTVPGILYSPIRSGGCLLVLRNRGLCPAVRALCVPQLVVRLGQSLAGTGSGHKLSWSQGIPDAGASWALQGPILHERQGCTHTRAHAHANPRVARSPASPGRQASFQVLEVSRSKGASLPGCSWRLQPQLGWRQTQRQNLPDSSR